MKDQEIDKSIEEKREVIITLSDEITSIMNLKPFHRSVKVKVDVLQEKLQRRTKLYENQLLDEKIEIYQEVLKEIK